MNDKFQSYLPALVVISCLGLIGFLVHEKADGATVLAVATVTTLIGYFAKAPDRRDPPSGAVVVAGLITAAAILFACVKPTPAQNVAIAETACKLVEGVTQNQTLISICAKSDEVALIATTIESFLREAPDAGACTVLPETTVCATKKEIGRGIQLVLERRRARLLDAGAP